ncbi:probable CCR4-associated factor 1 homolog 11 isoform X1 [Mangifera indica]|uniref:probable CCR4-associated factor 1 homolog 11 isoform X1 n=1 Tax=Mangifera indica TaxID=29780 RepID=UPI001CFC23EE|nr:probable CCR4-associated factor 1 homolog 11 isoform X1 [Mangifera indica]
MCAAKPPPSSPPRQIVIRSVFAENVEAELKIIGSLVDTYPIISMDTEFPGVVVRSEKDFRHQDPTENYVSLKANVDLLKLIQIGLTLSDEEGNLPDLGSGSMYYIWEFNFKDFDITYDAHAHDSVELLKRQGIDFEKNHKLGIDSVQFAEMLMSSGLVLNDAVTWVTFHSAYDFGYLVKCLKQRVLPENLNEFLNVLSVFFRGSVYDVKHLMRFCSNLHGGLDRVGKALNLERLIGKSHQAGSDSLFTLHAFLKIREKYFGGDDDRLENHSISICGEQPTGISENLLQPLRRCLTNLWGIWSLISAVWYFFLRGA